MLAYYLSIEHLSIERGCDPDYCKNLAKAVRELVDIGRIMFAIERYKKKKISLGKAAELAGMSIGEMMNILEEFGIESNVGYDDYS